MTQAQQRGSVTPPPGNSPVGAEEDESIAGEEDPGAALDEPEADVEEPASAPRSRPVQGLAAEDGGSTVLGMGLVGAEGDDVSGEGGDRRSQPAKAASTINHQPSKTFERVSHMVFTPQRLQ